MASRLTTVVGPTNVVVYSNNTFATEYESMAWGYPSPEAAWSAVVSNKTAFPYVHASNTYDNVGWVKGTKEAEGSWGAYLWLIQNTVNFKTSETNRWISPGGVTNLIANVVVGSIGDFAPMATITDIGPTNWANITNYPGANASEDVVYQGDYAAYYELLVLNVDLDKVWSDQIPDITCNYLPDGHGAPKSNGDHFLMIGARADNKVYLKGKVSILSNDPTVRSRVLFRLAEIDPADPSNVYKMTIRAGNSSVDSFGVMSLVSSEFSSEFHKVVAGVDTDGNNELANAEICDVSDHLVRLVGQGLYTSSHLSAIGIRDGFDVAGFFLAAEAIDEFINPAPESSYPHNIIDVSDYRLEHRVGLKLTSNCVDVTAQELIFGAMHAGALDVADSRTVGDLIKSSLNMKKSEVAAYFADPANSNQTFYIGDVAVSGIADYGTHLPLDTHPWLAFGKAEITLTCIFRVERNTMTVDLASVMGIQTDLYDWDYTIPSPYPDYLLAMLQTGFPTLGEYGRVYKSRVELNHDITSVLGFDMLP